MFPSTVPAFAACAPPSIGADAGTPFFLSKMSELGAYNSVGG